MLNTACKRFLYAKHCMQGAHSLSQESFNAPLDEGKSQYSIDRGTIARVVSQTQVNESLQVLAVTRGDGWVCTPVGVVSSVVWGL